MQPTKIYFASSTVACFLTITQTKKIAFSFSLVSSCGRCLHFHVIKNDNFFILSNSEAIMLQTGCDSLLNPNYAVFLLHVKHKYLKHVQFFWPYIDFSSLKKIYWTIHKRKWPSHHQPPGGPTGLSVTCLDTGSLPGSQVLVGRSTLCVDFHGFPSLCWCFVLSGEPLFY